MGENASERKIINQSINMISCLVFILGILYWKYKYVISGTAVWNVLSSHYYKRSFLNEWMHAEIRKDGERMNNISMKLGLVVDHNLAHMFPHSQKIIFQNGSICGHFQRMLDYFIHLRDPPP